ncbi:helix-turn-helix domain-containing protein [Caldalkalibacillus horti]|uniref:AraC-like DNA-binding protein n=1 Tax=Caldalkalibacillus horti TaxID=77523 RepID=A0ABT9VW82_9BACI|nr:helix-turn-helix domain-containing protein [Bacillus horti]MDQ0164880.1 AraC-like DNA-binding protein [Bacillus horti]
MNHKSSINYVLQASSREFYWEGNGQLSIKTFRHGRAHYRVNQGFFAVEQDRYLLLNEGPYSLAIEQEKDIDSFCLFFKDGLADEVQQSSRLSTDQLLTDPYQTSASPVQFFEKTYPHDPLLSALMLQLKSNLDEDEDEPVWMEQQYYNIMQRILQIHSHTLEATHSLSALRTATREELFKRVSLAHDYILAFFDQASLTLEQIARVACVSPNHLLRSYTEVFGRSPFQHVSELRVKKALQLLENTELPMTELTFRLGYSNPVSFSKMFKKHVGLSPLQYRKKVISDKNP